MDGDLRREKIIEELNNASGPVSATNLAKMFGVSRQIIVGDIALIRAKNVPVIATNSGYIMDVRSGKCMDIKAKIKPDDLYDEMCTIIDEGARIKRLYIKHDLYGEISVPLNITNRAEIKEYTEKALVTDHRLLSELTGGVFYQSVEADNDIVLIRVQRALMDKKYFMR